jgi:hypothetical protein
MSAARAPAGSAGAWSMTSTMARPQRSRRSAPHPETATSEARVETTASSVADATPRAAPRRVPARRPIETPIDRTSCFKTSHPAAFSRPARATFDAAPAKVEIDGTGVRMSVHRGCLVL